MQKGFVPIIILVVILVLGSVGGAYYFFKVKTPEQRACTMDTKICPDGSSVGRTGPNCEFSPCPSPKPSPTVSLNEAAVAKFIVQVIPAGDTKTIELSIADSGKTTTVPVGTHIYLRFGVGDYKYTFEPSTGVIEVPQGKYNLPNNVIGQLKAVGVGQATITVTGTPVIEPGPIPNDCFKVCPSGKTVECRDQCLE